jgi:hypothetical protein
MTVASDRLAAYIAAETLILQGQEIRQDLGDGRGYRSLKMVDLDIVRQVIKDLQAEVRAETRNATGPFGFSLANLSGCGDQ